MHEFTHTVEMQLKKEDSCSLHNAMSYYGKNIDSHYNTIFSFLSDYLIGNFYPESGYTGIPYEFWTGEYFN